MKPCKRLLVPIDFSPVSLEALAAARDLARTTGATMHLYHAVDDVAARYLSYPLDALGQVQTAVMDSAGEQLEELVEAERREGLQVESTLTVSTSPAQAIVDFAKDNAIDQIVMGTHGRGGMLRMMMGSVAERVVRTAPCPVTVVREHAPAGRRPAPTAGATARAGAPR